tara:strand:- start:587 stop:1744 length:1158 start_codon:yes stop_codon:yes gene_type:complete
LKKIKILCIDIEGGHGGSSRSLFYALEAIRHAKKFSNLDITVICKKKSWLKSQYKKIGIKCIIENDIPRFTPLKKNSRNFYQLLLFLIIIWPKSYNFRKKILASNSYDIIHFNHISLSFLARWCKLKKLGKIYVMHVRTMPVKTIFSKIVYKISEKYCDAFIYITENEKKNVQNIIQKPTIIEKIIYNPVKIFKTNTSILINHDSRFKIGILSNYSFNRGIDRAIEVYEAIPNNKKKDFLFVIAGDMTEGEHLIRYIKNKGYEKNFLFLGHIKNPEKVLTNINLLFKLTRQNNPWGRDILEALSFGKPAVSIGNYNKFIITNKTGYLQKKYNPFEIANWVINLETNKALQKKLSLNSVKIVKKLCNPDIIAEQLTNVWLDKLDKQ